ncbi:immunoglobulin-like and fibronectin type III domain-containing protein 1.1 [Genypterus blacodes]|uniref:immunoglobulin-like and fibronectin type III domain-containing protein 1.1 n=1 Tax=Genypterus blacodes TaxID=154954 RepID=UPI003F77601D
MWKKSKVTDPTASGQAGIRMKSKVPGVMITQYREELPEGMTTPDFTRKPIALTIQEGKHAIFKARVVGTPTPTITWSRANGEIIYHPDVCLQKYDEVSEEHTLEFPKVAPEDADTYKCFATNEYGRAICTVILNIIEVGFHKSKEFRKVQVEDAAELRKKLKKRNVDGTREEKAMEQEDKVWEILLSADKKDYERICTEYGITDFRGMLKKLKAMKKEREDEIAEFVSHISTLKHIEVGVDDCASFELDMDLKDPSSKVFLYKDGIMVPFTAEGSDALKHNLKQVGKKYVFTIKKLSAEDAGLYSVDVEGVNVFSTDFKVPQVDFAVKIKEVKAEEREDAIFQCVLTAPMNEVKWFGKSAPLTSSSKHEIIVSDDKLIHKLIVRDCMPLDAGIYAAVAGIKSCNAWLIVEGERGLPGKKATRKTTMAGGSDDDDLQKIAKEQQEKFQKEMEEKLEVAKKAQPRLRLLSDQRRPQVARMQMQMTSTRKKAVQLMVQALQQVALEFLRTLKVPVQPWMQLERLQVELLVVVKVELMELVVVKMELMAVEMELLVEKMQQLELMVVEMELLMELLGLLELLVVEMELLELLELLVVEMELLELLELLGVEGKDGVAGEGALAGAGGRATGDVQGEGIGEGQKQDKSYEESDDIDGQAKGGVGGEGEDDGKEGEDEETQRKKGVRTGPLVPDTVIEPGVHFHAGLSDCNAIMGQAAELECKLSDEACAGVWYKDGNEIKSSDGMTISKDGSVHKLKIHKVTEEYAGIYKFEADGRKTEAVIVVEDPPRLEADDLAVFKAPVTVKKGHKANFKMGFIGHKPFKVQWYLDSEELSDDTNIKLETSEGYTCLLLNKLQRKDTGEIKLKIKNEFGTVEAFSQLNVLDKSTPPTGPLETVEASSSAIEIKWRPPKDNGGCKVDNYILERQQIGRNTWKKVGPIGPEATYRDTDVDHGRRYCYRIRAETEIGVSELMETEDFQAGTKAYPAPPSQPKVSSASKDCINLTWSPPADTGGTDILGYNLEKRKKGSNLWIPVNTPDQMIRAKKMAVKDVVEGIQYEFRVSAINNSGAGEHSTPSEFVFARDPKKPPGKVIDFKVTDSTYTTLSLSWTAPKDTKGVEDEAKGYFVEIRPAENPEWDRCNSNAISLNFYTVKGLKSLAMYWVRVIAMNDGGQGEPQELSNYILAMPPPVRPRFTDAKMKSFMVVRAGNSARFNINFVASPWPEVTWLKDGTPVSKRATISNAEGTSQLLIPSSERSDTGIYTIIVKNIVGQETSSIEIRVTDEPKPPGPVEIDENVPGTVTISWTASPDERRDDRLHYMVTKRDSNKRSWHSVADRIFNNKFTVCNIMPGREYQFRVYAKNDMGASDPSESTKWVIYSKKEKFQLNMPQSKPCDLQSSPKFLVPLKMHTAPQGYECYMSCAVKGDPKPHVTWFRNNISLNTNTNYYISNTCGVCSMLILRVGSKDNGEYKVVAENSLGRVEGSTKLLVRGKV